MSDDPLEKIIHGNLDRALENEYDVRDWSVDEIASDLAWEAHDCLEIPEELMKPHIISWLALRRKVQ